MTSFYPHVKKRFSRESFVGLPLTLLAFFFVVSIGILLAVVRLYLARDPLLSLDANLAHLLYTVRGPQALTLFYFMTMFGEVGVALGTGVLLSIFLWVKKERLLVFAMWLAFGMSEGATSLGKLFFHRDRPDLALRAINITSFSFPSGHATTAAVFFGFLIYLMFLAYRSWRIRTGSLVIGTVFIVLVDLSRMYLGVHYLSDVVVGNFVGISGLLLSIVIIELIAHKRQMPRVRVFRISHLAITLFVTIVFAFILRTVVPLSATNKITVPVQSVQITDIADLFIQKTLTISTQTLTGSPHDPVSAILIVSPACFVKKIEAAHWSEIVWTAPLFLVKTFPDFYQGLPNDFLFEKLSVGGFHSVVTQAHAWDTHYATAEGSLYVVSAPNTFIADLAQARSVSSTQFVNLVSTSTPGMFPVVTLSGCDK